MEDRYTATGWFQDKKLSKEYLLKKYPLEELMEMSKYKREYILYNRKL